MMKQDSCDARIANHMNSRETDVGALFAIADGEKVECVACDGLGCAQCDHDGERTPEYEGETLDSDAALDRLVEIPLGISVRRVLRIDLSTGGPADWIEADLTDDNLVADVTYHFADWFDHAERCVDPGSALWRMAEYYAEVL